MFVARILANIVIFVLTFQLRPVCESRLGIGSNKSKTKTAFGVMDDSKLPHGRAEVRFPATGHARLVYYTHWNVSTKYLVEKLAPNKVHGDEPKYFHIT